MAALPLCESCKELDTTFTSPEGITYESKVVQTTPHLGLRSRLSSSSESKGSSYSSSYIFSSNDSCPARDPASGNKKSPLIKGAFKSLLCSLNSLMFSNQNMKWLPQKLKNYQGDKKTGNQSDYIDDTSFPVRAATDNNGNEYQMNFMDDEDEDDMNWGRDANSCVVCERVFFTMKELERHQLKKRHYGCSHCEQRFNTFILLEYHKEELDHWTDEESRSSIALDSDDSSDGMELDNISGDEEKEFLLL